MIATLIIGFIPLIGWLIAIVLGLLSFVISLGFLVLWVVHIIKAFTGVEWEMPYIGKIARQQLLKFPPAA